MAKFSTLEHSKTLGKFVDSRFFSTLAVWKIRSPGLIYRGEQ